MELKDTIEMMNSNDYKERLKAEYYQLKIRIEKLTAMLREYKAGKSKFKPVCPYELLFEQLIHMKSYMRVLQSCAHIEKLIL